MDEKELGTFARAHNASEDFVTPHVWRNVGSLTTAGGVLAAAEHLKATGDALADTITFDIPPGTISLEIRFRGTTEGHAPVFEIYGCAGDDWYMNLTTCSPVVGTAIGPDSTLFADTIPSLTNEAGLSTIGVASGAVNSVARLALNVHGYSSLLFTLSTAATGNAAVYVDVRKF
jgi:hypothetical protein